ncbi:1115_t:CDS:2, partial [Paraglomus brasilianum]
MKKLITAKKIVNIEQPNELLIKINASAVNPSDYKNVEGLFPFTTTPRVPGRDFCGTVVDGPPEWMGKVVIGTGGKNGFIEDGSHAEYITAQPDA